MICMLLMNLFKQLESGNVLVLDLDLVPAILVVVEIFPMTPATLVFLLAANVAFALAAVVGAPVVAPLLIVLLSLTLALAHVPALAAATATAVSTNLSRLSLSS